MLLVVMFMVTEFGRAMYQYNVLAQATREGARVAVVSAEALPRRWTARPGWTISS